MGKGRDKRKRNARKQELKTNAQTIAAKPSSGGSTGPMGTDTPVPVPIKSKPPARAGVAKAIPELGHSEDDFMLTGTTNRFQ
jgi:hypothetical protein